MELDSVEFYRITRKQKNPAKNDTPTGNWTQVSNFQALHATVCAGSQFAGCLRPLYPNIIMLYWSVEYIPI